MTDKKTGGRLGYDPLVSRADQRGVDSLIRQTAQDAHNTQPEQDAQRAQKLPRINMAFELKNLEYLRAVAGLDGISITAYVNRLIAADMEARRDTYQQIKTLKQEGKQ